MGTGIRVVRVLNDNYQVFPPMQTNSINLPLFYTFTFLYRAGAGVYFISFIVAEELFE
jgi:hypothetical protein